MKTVRPSVARSARLPRPLIDAIYEMNVAGNHADFATAVTTALGRLIPADVCHLHVVDRATGRILHHAFPANPFTPQEIAYYIAHPQENAFFTYFERTRDPRALLATLDGAREHFTPAERPLLATLTAAALLEPDPVSTGSETPET